VPGTELPEGPQVPIRLPGSSALSFGGKFPGRTRCRHADALAGVVRATALQTLDESRNSWPPTAPALFSCRSPARIWRNTSAKVSSDVRGARAA